jgi:hypothetical protein
MSVPSEADRAEMLERLTAYLDGELEAAEASEVERRLSAEPTWAAELQRLQRAWDLLDRLPRAEVGANFTHTTVEMIAVEAEAELVAVQHRPARRRGLDWVLLLGGAVAAAGAGFILIDKLRPPRDEELFRALPVLRNLDLYARTETGESAEFVKLLRDEHPLSGPKKP